MHGVFAIIERDLRRFAKSPAVMFAALSFPIATLAIFGTAFGGNLKSLKLGVVDQDHAVPALKLRELAGAVAANARTFDVVNYSDAGEALTDLRTGTISGAMIIPQGFSRRVLNSGVGHVAFVEDNTELFAAAALSAKLTELVAAYRENKYARHSESNVTLDVVEMNPFVSYVQYFLPGSIVLAIYTLVMIGSGSIFVEEKARGLHESFLAAPITTFKIALGFILGGSVRATLFAPLPISVAILFSGLAPFEFGRVALMFATVIAASSAFSSLMFVLMVRVEDPMLPRVTFGILNLLLTYPSGAYYPVQGLPPWLKVVSACDPFTYAVHAFRVLLFKEPSWRALGPDMLFLMTFAAGATALSAVLFKRSV